MFKHNSFILTTLALAFSFGAQASSQLMTVAEFEKELAAINASKVETQAKLQRIKDLTELFDAQEELKRKLHRAANPKLAPNTNKSPATANNQNQATVQKQKLSNKDDIKEAKRKILIPEHLDLGNRLYLVDYQGVGSYVEVLVIHEGRVQPISLTGGDNNNERIGNYIIRSAKSNTITSYNTKTKETTVHNVRSEADVKSEIAFVTDLRRTYLEKATLTAIDVQNQLKISGNDQSNGMLLPVNYQTQAQLPLAQ